MVNTRNVKIVIKEHLMFVLAAGIAIPAIGKLKVDLLLPSRCA
jgi:hypothetical protein